MKRTAAALTLAVSLVALAGCAASPEATTAPTTSASSAADASDCASGVGVIVEYGTLDADVEDVSTCVSTTGAIIGVDALADAGVKTEGTKEYGDQVVCRVNGEPSETTKIPATDGSEYSETCAGMPAAFAYWSIWTKPADGDWAYATEGLSTLKLQPGEQLALLFQIDGAPEAPTS